MKLKLGAQIGLGFGTVILIVALLGGLAIFNMKGVTTLATELAEEFAPEVDVASRIDRQSLHTMYAIRGYAFTEDKSYLEEGRKSLDVVRQSVGEAEALARKSPHLTKLKEQIGDIRADIERFGKLVDEGEAMVNRMDKTRTELDTAAVQFTADCAKYLTGQNGKIAKQFREGATAEKNLERLHKISVINEVIDLDNAIRVATWRAQAKRDLALIGKAQEKFPSIQAKLDELISLSSSAEDVESLTNVKKAAATYSQQMEELKNAWQRSQAMTEQRSDLGDEVVNKIAATAAAGLKHTLEIAASTATTLNMASNIMIAGLVVALALAAGVAYFITISITRPVTRTVHMLDEMAKGHLDMRLNMDRGDEIGRMAAVMDRFSDSLQEEMVTSLEKLADGDLTFDATPHDEADVIRNSLKKTGDDLNVMIGDILTATEQVASGAGQVSDASQALSQGATEQAASLEEITSSMTEMASQTKLNAENAAQANQLAGQTRAAAEGGNAKMQEMVKAMGEINEAGENISKIIKVIDEIAFQTNLLALNAAVEAARAGRHGKGFAVVAEEVRNLAARSAKAAKETAELIEGSVEKTRNGTQIAEATSEALAEIVSSVTKVTDLVGEIAAASNEQAQGINQTNQALSQIDQVTQQNTASAEESAAASEELSGQAMHMKEMMTRFKLRDLGRSTGRQQALPRPATAAKPRAEWGAAPQPAARKPANPAPREVIALDDQEFGKY